MPIRTPDMTAHGTAATSSGLNPAEILIAVFKHKWKLLICTVAGFAAAVAFCALNPPEYQSDAKLLVRYVVERSAVDPVDSAAGADAADRPSDSVLNSEVEILSSWDLFEQVAEEIGVNRLCPAAKDATNTDGAAVIAGGLTVAAVPKTNVILVSYKNGNPELAPLVLQALLEAYFSKHLDIHRSKAAFDLVSQQTDIVRAELAKTEEDLKKKKAEANIISVDDTASNLNMELADTERQVNAATTALAEQRALVKELEKSYGSGDEDRPQSAGAMGSPVVSIGTARGQAGGGPVTSGSEPASIDDVERYQGYLAEIASLEKKDLDLRASYLPESAPVQLNESQIQELEGERRDLERKHPDLTQQVPAGEASSSHESDLITERARLASLEAGMETLQTRLRNVQERAAEFAKVAPDIEELERNKQLEQTDYTNSQSKLENATVDEALDPSKIPNISTFQKPSPAMRVAGSRQKIAIVLAGGGFALGLALALFIEIVVDQTVKRPLELEQRLGIPLLLSIPFVSGGGRLRLPGPRGKKKEAADGDKNGVAGNGHGAVAPWEVTHFVRPYAEAIRDSLGLYFDVNNITHKPKLLAVVGFSDGSGASTLAAGIASALSETGDGKILLVDMNVGHTEVHPFFKGRPACSLTEALSREGPPASAADNLYLATTGSAGTGSGNFGVKRFQELIPYLNASDFDYVLFDMPPLSQTSPASAMTAFMDKVFFVIEAEKSTRSLVKRGYAQLIARKADVSVIFNKVRSHAPKWIEGGI
jgi:uncharacterized protein involved in exopolysaccharide biosynthesis/Mrp family chromosome partitioning ATPase